MEHRFFRRFIYVIKDRFLCAKITVKGPMCLEFSAPVPKSPTNTFNPVPTAELSGHFGTVMRGVIGISQYLK